MFSGKFICAGYDYTTYTSHVPAPYFRKAFEIDGEVKKSVITLTGLGFYELYVNGQRLTKGILAPYISNPDDLVYYDEYDITECLVPGKNVLGIMLGNGMQNAPGGQIWDFDIAAFRGAPRTAFCVSTEYIDGKINTFEADGSVKTAPPRSFSMTCAAAATTTRALKFPAGQSRTLTTARGKTPCLRRLRAAKSACARRSR